MDNKYTELVAIDLYLLTYQFLSENKKITNVFIFFSRSALAVY